VKKKTNKKAEIKRARALQRKLALQQGYYDGRYRPRVVKDKKKEADRRKARRKVNEKEE
jgi:hypothetical protein